MSTKNNSDEKSIQQSDFKKQLEILKVDELQSLSLLDYSANELKELMQKQAKKENLKPFEVETGVKTAAELRNTLKLKLDVIKFATGKK